MKGAERMTWYGKVMGTGVLLLALVASVHAGKQETKTVDSAAVTVRALSEIPLKGIPQALLRDAAGVAIVPHVVKAGLVVDGRFGRGVICVHEPNGCWSDPLFITLSGGGIGGLAGIESTQLVLVFKTKKSLDRAIQGKLALGSDAAIAAGPIGRDAEAATDTHHLRAEIYSYSRSKGLFVGLSLEGSVLKVDSHANEAFYGVHNGLSSAVLARHGAPVAAAEALKTQLIKLSGLPPVPVVVPPQPPTTVLVPVPAPVPPPPPVIK
jgi:lipid-binding SYLF domain-containing protein